MKLRCAGFVHSNENASLWSPCARAPLRGDRFCALHRDAVDGAVLTIFMNGFSHGETHPDAQEIKSRRIARNQKAKNARLEASPQERAATARIRSRREIADK